MGPTGGGAVQPLTYWDHLRILAGTWGVLWVLFGLAAALAGAGILAGEARKPRERRSSERAAGGLLLIAGGLLWSYLQTLVPTRYAANPLRGLSAAEVSARAMPIYLEHCAACHGEKGRGDGPLAEFVTPRPADFGTHGWHHREGEHYWWITRGIPGTAMPSFASFLTEEERWLLARYVKQLGREARLP